MKLSLLSDRVLPLVLAAALMSGCAPKDEAPARQAIDRIDAAIKAAGPDATKYIPRHVSTLETESAKLKVRFYDRDYKGVIEAAPAILEKAQELGKDASAKKSQVAASLAGEWTNLEKSVPEAIAAVDAYVDGILKSSQRPAGINATIFDSAKPSIAEQRALWDKAVKAKAAGDIEQAVTLGTYAKHNAEVLLAALGGRTG
jgi:hypothetical protein